MMGLGYMEILIIGVFLLVLIAIAAAVVTAIVLSANRRDSPKHHNQGDTTRQP